MTTEPLFDYYDIHLTGYTVLMVEEPETDSDDEPTEYELEL